MQYDDGSGDVQPGPDIVLNSHGTPEDLGAATYDSDHDRVADSVIVGQDDHTLVITDSDHDGTADSGRAYDEHGAAADPHQTGSSSAPPDGHQGATAHDAAGSGEDPGPGPQLTVTEADGSVIHLGGATVDLDQDGHPDTVVVRGSDGTVTGYTDRDGDGMADQLTQIHADHRVVIAVSDGAGGWSVVATGQLDASGVMIDDPTPEPGVTVHLPDAAESTHGACGETGAIGQNGVAGVCGADTAGNGPADGSAASPGPGTVAHSITYSVGGYEYGLGAPTHDMDQDGTPDTVVVDQGDGTVVGYTDTSGDGVADQVTQIYPDGSVVIGMSDGHGGWHQVASGHRASDGSFIPDQPAGAGAGAGAGVGAAARQV